MQINSVQFRASCFKILEEVAKTNKEVIITKRGKPVAKLVPIKAKGEKDPFIGALTGVGSTIGDLTEPTADFEHWEID